MASSTPVPPPTHPASGATPSGTSTGSGQRPRMAQTSSKVLQRIMFVTGGAFSLFLLAHLLGNLQIYLGPEVFNHYAMKLRTMFSPPLPYEGLLWVARTGLVVCLVFHVVCSQVVGKRMKADFASGAIPTPPPPPPLLGFARHIAKVTGWVLILFVVFHLLDLTIGQLVATQVFTPVENGVSSAYQNLVASFSRPWVAAFYIIVMLGLAFHVLNGLITVIVHDSGLKVSLRWQRWVTILAGAFALFLLLGNASIPVAVLTGIVG